MYIGKDIFGKEATKNFEAVSIRTKNYSSNLVLPKYLKAISFQKESRNSPFWFCLHAHFL
jgi:hypothetical protein